VPAVVSVSYDRAFPHTLRVRIVPERTVAVLRRGPDSWLVSARGRVLAPIPNRRHRELPRIWVPRQTNVAVGAFLSPLGGGTAARMVALARRFPAHIVTVSLDRNGLVFRLHSGLELRLGDPNDVRLKLAIARRALSRLPAGTTYFDVSVPERPVAGVPDNPQFSTTG
jgi:cell division septal protein FtsQ